MQYQIARSAMIDSQVRTNRVVWHELLMALQNTPRELFVPEKLKPIAYSDEHLQFDNSRFELSPMVATRLIDLLSPKTNDNTLIIGSGYGYIPAVVSQLVRSVTAIEESSEMQKHAQQAAKTLNIKNISFITQKLTAPIEKSLGQFNTILLCGGVSQKPLEVLKSLEPHSRCVGILKPAGGVGRAIVWGNGAGDSVSETTYFDANANYLTGYEPVERFIL